MSTSYTGRVSKILECVVSEYLWKITVSIHWPYSTCCVLKLEPSKVQQKKAPSNARGQTCRVLLVKDFIGLIDWNFLK